MNIRSTDLPGARGRAAWAALTALALGALALAGSGCSNHGPVNLFGPELFNRAYGPPQIAFYSLQSNSFNTFYPSPGCTTCYSGPPGQPWGALALTVTVADVGGSGTYGPISVSFTSSDCHVVWDYSGPGSSLYTCNGINCWQNPPSASQNAGDAISTFGPGSEILPASQNPLVLAQGDYVGGAQNFVNQGLSAAFYYTPNSCCGSGASITVPITMTMWDGFNNQYVSTFDIYITQQYTPASSSACPAPPNW